MKKIIAFFDFDGTVTTHDTLLEAIKFMKGDTRFYGGFLLNSPFLVAMKAGLMSNQAAKEKVLTHFFGGHPLEQFQQRCNQFAEHKLASFMRPKALEEITKLKALGATVVIVSASAENWLRQWCHEQGIELLATKLQVAGDRLTGRIAGLNCYGEEKVRRIREAYDLTAYNEIYCYGDTNGDKPMLGLATVSFYKPFR